MPLGVSLAVMTRAAPVVDAGDSFTFSIAQSSDDAGELTGTMSLDSGTLTSNGTRILGFRFVTDIPQGSSLVSGANKIQFTCGGTNAGAHTATIWCEDADDAATFAATASNISGRTKTSASVSWVIPDWTQGDRLAAQLTPDLTSIMQPVINRASFGGSLVFIIQRTAGTENRNFASFDHVSFQEPVLSGEWTAGFALDGPLLTFSSAAVSEPWAANITINSASGNSRKVTLLGRALSDTTNTQPTVSMASQRAAPNGIPDATGSEAWAFEWDDDALPAAAGEFLITLDFGGADHTGGFQARAYRVAKQSVSLGALATAAAAQVISDSLTPVEAGGHLIDFVWSDETCALTPDAGQAESYGTDQQSSGFSNTWQASTKTGVPASSTSMGWSSSVASQALVMNMVVVEPIGEAPASVPIDSTAHYASTGALGDHTTNHVIGALANKVLIGITAEGALPRDLDQVDIGGVVATRFTRIQSTDDEQAWLYYLDNPPTGTQAVNVSWDGIIAQLQFTSISLIGAAAGDPEDDGSSVTTGSPSTVNLTPSVGAILLDWLIIQGSGTITVGGNQTELANMNAAFHPHGCSSQAAAAGGDMSWTISVTSTERAHLAISVAPE